MIPCPHCEREFEKRAGLMRHITVSHPHEPYTGEGPVNLDDQRLLTRDEARELVDPETYAESLDEPAPGQEPYVDPPIGPPTREEYESGVISIVDPPVTWDQEAWDAIKADAERVELASLTTDAFSLTPVHLTMGDPTPEQYKQIRAFIRSGRSESEAWMNVVGYEPPPRPPQPVDERPLRLQQVAFRVRNGGIDQIDARWLLHLAEIGADAIGLLDSLDPVPDSPGYEAIERWKAAIQ
jgi:hypothetical protein